MAQSGGGRRFIAAQQGLGRLEQPVESPRLFSARRYRRPGRGGRGGCLRSSGRVNYSCSDGGRPGCLHDGGRAGRLRGGGRAAAFVLLVIRLAASVIVVVVSPRSASSRWRNGIAFTAVGSKQF